MDRPFSLRLEKLINLERLDRLIESFYETTGIGITVIDRSGKIKLSHGWREVCNSFHRSDPEISVVCRKNAKFLIETAKKEGSWHNTCPMGFSEISVALRVGDHWVGTILAGQFFAGEPDLGKYKNLAETYGFEVESYLESIKQCPVLPPQKVGSIVSLLNVVVDLMADVGGKNLIHRRTEKELKSYKAELQTVVNKRTTELNSAMISLNLSENRFRLLVGSMGDMVFILNRDHVMEEVYGKWPEDIGIAPRLVKGKRPTEIFEPRTALVHDTAADRAFRGEMVVYEWTFAHKDGVAHFQTSLNPLFYDSDNVSHLVGVTRDVTKLKLAELAIREEAQFRSAVISNVAEGLFVCYEKPESPFVEFSIWNDRLTEILGFGIEEANRRDVFGKVLTTTDENGRTRLAYKLTGKSRDEVTLTKKNGSQVVVSMSTSLFQSADGRINLLGVVNDITEKRQMEEQLAQAQKLQAIGTLAGGVAHDFNNIIMAIQGYSEVILEDLGENSPHAASIKHILTASRRAAQVVRQILAFSRKREQSREETDLVVLIREVSALVRSVIPTSIEIVTKVPDHAIISMVEASQIHQVLMNLCANARDSLGPVLGRLTLEAGYEEILDESLCEGLGLSPGGFARITVADTGAGMDEATMRRIFEPYFSTKEVGKGSGLGLSVVHGIVVSHGGWIGVESKPGEGAKFTILLPARVDSAGEKQVNDSEIPKTKPLNVLIVDDEEGLSEVMGLLVESLGHNPRSFTDPKLALEAYKADPGGFDLVITDQTMPQMTGDMFLANILEINPKARVVIYSGYSDVLTNVSASQIGAFQILQKPVNRHQLGQLLAKAGK